jgi:hypothetical protein
LWYQLWLLTSVVRNKTNFLWRNFKFDHWRELPLSATSSFPCHLQNTSCFDLPRH